jgi:hypothetical protein
LLNAFMLTYMDSQFADLPLGLSHAETLPILFTSYVRRMLKRRSVLRSTNKKRAIVWLTFLAKQMRRYNQTILSIETIQPSGITARQDWIYRVSYALEVGLLFFLVLGPLTFLAYGLGLWLDNRLGHVSYTYFEYQGLYALGQMVIDRHLVLPPGFYIARALPISLSMGLFIAFWATANH